MNFPSIFEYLPEQARYLCKVAGEPEPKSSTTSALKTIGTGLLGFGTGSLAGAGGALLLDKWHEAATGKKIPLSTIHAAAPIIGGAAGLTYSIYKAREIEELRRAIENKSNQSQGRIPRQ